jgi:hypothetical protein
VSDKLLRKLGEKEFRGVMVGYPHVSPWHRVYNPAIRRITTSVHVVFQENTPGLFGARQPIDSVITDDVITITDADDPQDTSPKSYPLALDTTPISDTHSPHEADRPSHLKSQPTRYGELVAHMPDYPPVLVTACCDPEHGKSKEDIFEQPSVPNLITGPHHLPAGASLDSIALLSARDSIEPKSYRDALSIAHAPQWQAAM